MSSKHARIMTSEHGMVTLSRSVNTDQWHAVLKTCLQHDQWIQTNDITLSWKHALAWSVNTDQWHHTILKTYLDHDQWTLTNDISHPENMPWPWSVNTECRHHPLLKTCHGHDQQTHTNDVTLSGKNTMIMINKQWHHPVPIMSWSWSQDTEWYPATLGSHVLNTCHYQDKEDETLIRPWLFPEPPPPPPWS